MGSKEQWFHLQATSFNKFYRAKKLKKLDYSTSYRIYLINGVRRLLNSWTLRVGVYARWVLIRGWALIKISASVVCLFCRKTINGNNKMQRRNKARFLSHQKKTPSLRSLLLVVIQFFGGWEREGGGVRVGAYLSLSERRRGWALINFFCLQDGRLFKVGANLRLGAYSNKYGTLFSVSILRK